VILRGGVVATLDPPRVERADLRVDGGRIVERASGIAPLPGEDVLEVAGGLVLPGLVNAHTHLYSALARGMPAPAVAPRNFVEVLERVWWRLDRALDLESVYLSGLWGAIDAARSGTTVLFDHHSSPSAISGSLAVLRRAIEEVGLRSVLCYETTDRNGPAGREAGLAENAAFAAAAGSETTRAMIGAHASFTLGEEALAAVARACTCTWRRTARTSTTAARAGASRCRSAWPATGCAARAPCGRTASTWIRRTHARRRPPAAGSRTTRART
jgi:cytosine/adenosine deaminase-related metal-dependent hydrolase